METTPTTSEALAAAATGPSLASTILPQVKARLLATHEGLESLKEVRFTLDYGTKNLKTLLYGKDHDGDDCQIHGSVMKFNEEQDNIDFMTSLMAQRIKWDEIRWGEITMNFEKQTTEALILYIKDGEKRKRTEKQLF